MDQTRHQQEIPLAEGRSKFGDVNFFLGLQFLSLVRMFLFSSSKYLDVEKKDKDAF